MAAGLLGLVGVVSLQATGAAPAAATGTCSSGGYGCYSIITTPPTGQQAANIGVVTPNVESGVAVQTVTAPAGENLSPWSFASYDGDTFSYSAPDANDQISVYAQVGVAQGQLPGCFTSSGGPTCQVLKQFPVGSYGCAPGSGACDLTVGITGGSAGTADYFEAWIFNSSGSPLYCGGIYEIDWQSTTQASATATLSASPTTVSGAGSTSLSGSGTFTQSTAGSAAWTLTICDVTDNTTVAVSPATTGSSASVSGSQSEVSGYGAVTFVAVVAEAGVSCDSPPPACSTAPNPAVPCSSAAVSVTWTTPPSSPPSGTNLLQCWDGSAWVSSCTAAAGSSIEVSVSMSPAPGFTYPSPSDPGPSSSTSTTPYAYCTSTCGITMTSSPNSTSALTGTLPVTVSFTSGTAASGPGICGIGVEVNGNPVAVEASGGTAYVSNPNGSIPASVSVTAYYVTCGYSYTSGPESIYDSYCGCYTAGPEPSVTDTWYGVAQGVGFEAPNTGTWTASNTANGSAGASSPSSNGKMLLCAYPSATCTADVTNSAAATYTLDGFYVWSGDNYYQGGFSPDPNPTLSLTFTGSSPPPTCTSGCGGTTSPPPPPSGPAVTCSVAAGNGPSVISGATTCTVYTGGSVGFSISDPNVTSSQFLQVDQQNSGGGPAWLSDGVGGSYGVTSASGSIPVADLISGTGTVSPPPEATVQDSSGVVATGNQVTIIVETKPAAPPAPSYPT